MYNVLHHAQKTASSMTGYLPISQPQRSHQGQTLIIKSLVKVGFTVDVTHHLMFEDDERKKKKQKKKKQLNELERQK